MPKSPNWNPYSWPSQLAAANYRAFSYRGQMHVPKHRLLPVHIPSQGTITKVEKDQDK